MLVFNQLFTFLKGMLFHWSLWIRKPCPYLIQFKKDYWTEQSQYQTLAGYSKVQNKQKINGFRGSCFICFFGCRKTIFVENKEVFESVNTLCRQACENVTVQMFLNSYRQKRLNESNSLLFSTKIVFQQPTGRMKKLYPGHKVYFV